MAEERLQKLLSQAGVASRRASEQLILEGRVTLNGAVITELGTKADLVRDHIKVDGKLIHAPKNLVYVMLNKPKNTVTTVSDPEGRNTVMEYLRRVRERVFPVGRLDYASEGLLLFTNDGEFANAITKAKNRVVKTYVVKATGLLTEDQQKEFAAGLVLEGRRTAPAGLKLIRRGENPWYEVKLIEGRQNQIRKMFANYGLLVEKLRRVKVAFLDLGPLEPGEYRHLTPAEVAHFRSILKLDEPR